MDKKLIIYTIGHSTRSLDEFLETLHAYKIQKVIDIRTIARSRHNPQFNEQELKDFLHKKRLGYKHMENLGGLRHTSKDSVNTAWRNSSFRGYADYMQTSEFAAAIDELLKIAQEKQIVIMCAEAVPWRCHRSLVGDALLVRGVAVEDIYDSTHVKPHKLTPWAHVRGTHITYPEHN